MRTLFEDQSSAQQTYPIKEQITIFHEERKYLRIGKSYEDRSLGWRSVRVVELIGYVALGILCLLIPFIFNSFRQSIKTKSIEVLSGQEQIDHWIPKSVERKEQLRATLHLVPHLKDGFKTVEIFLTGIRIESAKCFVRIGFEHGEIKKEFIIENLTNVPLEETFLEKQAVKIKQHLDAEIKESLGVFIKLDLIFLLKDAEGRLHKRTNNEEKRFSTDEIEDYSRGQSTIMDLKQKEMGSTLTFLMNTMGFPKERHFENGKFIPGTFYQSIT